METVKGAEVFSKWETISNEIADEEGTNDPVEVNQQEKSKWQLIDERFQQEEFQKLLKEGRPLKYGDTSWGKAIRTGFSNFSTVDMFSKAMGGWMDAGESINKFLAHPIKTGRKMKEFALNMTKAMAVDFLDAKHLETEKQLTKDDPFAQTLLMEREIVRTFATEKGLKNFIAENPEEAFITLGELFMGAGKVAKIMPGQRMTKIGTVIEKTGAMMDPLNLAMKPLTKGPQLAAALVMKTKKFKGIPNNLYGRALKLADKIPIKRQQELIDIALKNESTFSMDDYHRLGDQIGEVNDVVNGLITKYDKRGYMLFNNAFRGLDDLAIKELKVSGNSVMPDIEAVKKVLRKNKSQYEKLTGLSRDMLSPTEVQGFKVKFNQELSAPYQRLMKKIYSSPMKVKAKMAINKNYRQFLEAIVPETALIRYKGKLTNELIQKHFKGHRYLSLKELNHVEGAMIELRNAMNSAVQKSGKGSLFDFQLTAKAATGTMAGTVANAMINKKGGKVLPGVGFVVGGAIGVLDSNPLVKSKLAVYLNSLKTVDMKIRPNAALLRMGLYEIGKEHRSFEDEEGDVF